VALLEVADLRTYLHSRRGINKAVDGVSFSLDTGKSLGVVGESGSGKSMTALSILRLMPQPYTRIVGGSIRFDGEDLLGKSDAEMREIRGGSIAIILQDPMTSLNPVFSVGYQVGEAVELHQQLTGKAKLDAVIESLRRVRVPAPETRMKDYPHQFSGGMRQRVVGAIAIACRPKLLIADEATTALDATIQAQYLALLRSLQRELNLAFLFITHDFGIVAKMCDEVAVMYAGRIRTHWRCSRRCPRSTAASIASTRSLARPRPAMSSSGVVRSRRAARSRFRNVMPNGRPRFRSSPDTRRSAGARRSFTRRLSERRAKVRATPLPNARSTKPNRSKQPSGRMPTARPPRPRDLCFRSTTFASSSRSSAGRSCGARRCC